MQNVSLLYTRILTTSWWRHRFGRCWSRAYCQVPHSCRCWL